MNEEVRKIRQAREESEQRGDPKDKTALRSVFKKSTRDFDFDSKNEKLAIHEGKIAKQSIVLESSSTTGIHSGHGRLSIASNEQNENLRVTNTGKRMSGYFVFRLTFLQQVKVNVTPLLSKVYPKLLQGRQIEQNLNPATNGKFQKRRKLL